MQQLACFLGNAFFLSTLKKMDFYFVIACIIFLFGSALSSHVIR